MFPLSFPLLVTFWLAGNPCPDDMAAVNLFGCMDRYEAPNEAGAKPLVMQSAIDAEAWCGARQKRLCSEYEWEDACNTATEPCNNDKQWKAWNPKTATSAPEIARLWQGSPSGAYESCRTPGGIFDLKGNVEEWTVAKLPGPYTKKRRWKHVLKGGWWASKAWCSRINDEHEPTFRFYQTGFRCCMGR